MTRSDRPLPHPIHTEVHGRRLRTQRSRLRLVARCLLLAEFLTLLAPLASSAEPTSPMLLADVVAQQADQLAAVDSDEQAMTLFTTAVGPALGLKDAAGALGAKRLPGKLVKELKLAELSESVFELMGALALWQLAETVDRDASQPSTATAFSEVRQEWLRTRAQNASLGDLFRLAQEYQAGATSEVPSDQHHTKLLLVAQRTAFEASRQATKAWWDIQGWKDRIRQAKGLARLCGTWQWTIHNHQNHGDQKAVVMFPPAGQTSAHAAIPAETIVLGDAIYLRWENNGRIQEDSLLFVKDDAKIEGSFVNNTGGWGSITGKRTAACQP
ncbi:MAG: hypothetical protein CV089_08660 [Nitrospira sp. WS110]|nr:hypothetical protein [Nitrospira sp. WS110]